MSIPSIKLYTYFGFSAPWRAAIALKLKKIPYTPILIDLPNKQQLSDEYTKLNPCKTVPALLYGNTLIQESMAIIQFLDEQFPSPPLLPGDPYARAQIRAISETVNSGIHPYHASRYYNWLGEYLQNVDKKDVSKNLLHRGFSALDAMLAKTKGKFSFGDSVTMADLFVYPTIAGNDVSYHVDVANYPNIASVVTNLKSLPEFQMESH